MFKGVNKIYKTQQEKLRYILNINCCEGTGIKLIIDAQCALRRSIEIYSKTTRFIIILEDKNKLLKPLISRFCDN